MIKREGIAVLFKIQASKLTKLLYNQEVSLSTAELVRSILSLSALDKKRAASLLLANEREDILSLATLNELTLAIKECFIQEQLIAAWFLMAKSDQQLVADALAGIKMRFIRWPALNNKIICDRHGERYLLRVLLNNVFFPSVYIDLLDPEADFSGERWPLDAEIDEPLQYDKNLKKNTVARFNFSFLEKHIEEIDCLEREYAEVPLKKLKHYFSDIELSRSEILSVARGRGLYKKLAENLALIMPKGAVLSLKEIIEEETVKKLKTGVVFSETVFGKSFHGKTFKVIYQEVFPAASSDRGGSVDVLLEKK